jgi:RNA polymerase sigma-70 factor (ECF subfamily)
MRASNGEPAALAILLEEARPVVYGWAVQRVEDPDDAEDVTQLVLFRLWRGISAFRGESRLSSWLFRITANESSALHRDERRRSRFVGVQSPGVGAERSNPSELERIHLRQACGKIRSVACALPPLQLAAFRLVDLDGLRPCEAARALGRSQANIRSSLCRARKRIRELVEQAGEGLAEDLVSTRA